MFSLVKSEALDPVVSLRGDFFFFFCLRPAFVLGFSLEIRFINKKQAEQIKTLSQ